VVHQKDKKAPASMTLSPWKVLILLGKVGKPTLQLSRCRYPVL